MSVAQPKAADIHLSAEQVTIRVYPSWEGQLLAGWIEGGWLDTVAGPPARNRRVEVGPVNPDTQDVTDYHVAIRCILQRGYLNVWTVDERGEKQQIQ